MIIPKQEGFGEAAAVKVQLSESGTTQANKVSWEEAKNPSLIKQAESKLKTQCNTEQEENKKYAHGNSTVGQMRNKM